MNLRLIPYDSIDRSKWDECIDRSANSLIYAKSAYLDHMAVAWDAIISGDYEAVMPLPKKTKWGISYVYQPAFIQQGGIFSPVLPGRELIQAFITELKNNFRFAEFTMNYGNDLSEITGITSRKRTNYTISLKQSYESIFERYQPSFTKSLRRIKKFRLVYKSSKDYESIISLYKNLYASRLPFFSESDYENFTRLCSSLADTKNVHTRIATDHEGNLMAAVVLLSDENRLYNMISCITEPGKLKEANYFLYDEILHEFSSTPYLLDLEGSDVSGIKTFYKKFNPQSEPYPFVKFNSLPLLLRLFKK